MLAEVALRTQWKSGKELQEMPRAVARRRSARNTWECLRQQHCAELGVCTRCLSQMVQGPPDHATATRGAVLKPRRSRTRALVATSGAWGISCFPVPTGARVCSTLGTFSCMAVRMHGQCEQA